MTGQPAVDSSVWYECKAFFGGGTSLEAEKAAEFRGERAEAEAGAWYERMCQDNRTDAVYMYEVHGAEHRLVRSWAATYGPSYEEDADDEDWYDDLDTGDDELDDEILDDDEDLETEGEA
jgi:hypothetical protein